MSAIKVGLRFRPVLKKENPNLQQWIVNGSTIRSKNQKYHFSFVNVFDDESTNSEVYEKLASPIVEKFIDGYNGTILTFGQTSSGKTHTMVGNQSTTGLIEMAIDDILKNAPTHSQLHVGYIEVYNEKIFDLLDDKKCELKIFERKGETMTSQKQFEVKSKDDIISHFRAGNRCKKMGESIINDNSSRSHTIFRITLENFSDGLKKTSNLFLVDLAGSEKPDMTKNSFNEGLFINKSLLALGKIVRQLSEKNVNVKKLRYRDSILTRLLSPALGGNSFTSIICTLSPTSLDETFYTICFAENAERARCKPILNTSSNNSKEVKYLRDELKRLQNELELTKTAIFNESCLNCTANVVAHDKNISVNLESTRKRLRCNDNDEMPAQKIFVKTVELQDFERDEIESLREKLKYFEIDNEKLKNELRDAEEKWKGEERKNVKLNQKNIFFKGALHEKNQQIKTMKDKIAKDNHEVVLIYRNLMIHALENQLKNANDKNEALMKKFYDFDAIINEKDEKIFVLSQAIEKQNYIEQDLNGHLKSSIQMLQTQLRESENLIREMNDENSRLKNINESLKSGFKASLKNTRNQFNELVRLKQEQAASFRAELQEFRNEELKNHLKLQDFHHVKYNEIRSKNEALNAKNLELQMEIRSKDEELIKLRNQIDNSEKSKDDIKKHGMEKIKFIKQQFQNKLLDKTNQFQKMLKAKDCELKNIIRNQSTTDSFVGEIFNSTMKHELIAH